MFLKTDSCFVNNKNNKLDKLGYIKLNKYKDYILKVKELKLNKYFGLFFTISMIF